jgi:hypothetical protein
VAEGGNFRTKHREEGEYIGKIIKVEDDKSKAGNERWTFTVQVDGDARSTYPFYCEHASNQFWKIRQVLVAAGITVPRKRVGVDPNKVVNKAVGIILEDHEWNDRMSSSIAELIPVADVQDALNEDAKPTATKRRAAAPVEDEDVEDVEDDVEDETPPPPRKRARKAAPPPPEDDEDDDDDPPPPPRRRAKATPPPADDDDLDLDDDDDVPPPPRKRAAKRARAAAPPADEDDDLDEL